MLQDLNANIVKFIHERELTNPEKKPELLYDTLKEEYTNYYSSEEFTGALRGFLEASFKGYSFQVTQDGDLEYRSVESIKSYGKKVYNIGPYRIRMFSPNGEEISDSEYTLTHMVKFNEDLTFDNSSIACKLEIPNGILKINKKYELQLKNVKFSLVKDSGKLNEETLTNLLVVALWKKSMEKGITPVDSYIRENFKLITGRSLSEDKLIKSYVTDIRKIKDYNTNYGIDVEEFIRNYYSHFFQITAQGKRGVLDFIKRARDHLCSITIPTGNNTKDYYSVYQVEEDTPIRHIKKGIALNERLFGLLSKYGTIENIEESVKTGILHEDLEVNERLFFDELQDKYILIQNGNYVVRNIAKIEEQTISNYTMLDGKLTQEYLSYDNIICIISYLFNGALGLIEDVDKEFKKTVTSATEVLNKIMAEEIRHKMYDYNTNDIDKVSMDRNNARGLITKQINFLMSKIRLNDVVEYIDTNNVIKEIANPLRVTLKTTHVSDNARVITLKQFGILSPYTTPSSQKIGITRALSKYARKIDGVFRIPLYKVTNRKVDTSKIDYLTVEEYMDKKVAFVSTFEHTNNYITSNIVQATVKIKNVLAIQNISADELEYVTVSSDSILTFVELLIPFMSNDDGARILYAVSMMTQAVSLQSNEIPFVLTDEYINTPRRYEYMYKEADSDYDVSIRARHGDIELTSPNGKIMDIPMEPKYLAKFPLTKRSYLLNEDNVVEGDILYDTVQSKKGILSVGKNLLVGFVPLDGWNGDDAYIVSEACKAKLSSINIFTEKIRENDNSIVENTMHTPKTSKYVDKYAFLFDKRRIDKGERSTETELQFISIDTFNKGDKVVGRHGNKGVSAYISKNTDMICLKNNIPLDIVFNQLGLSSRMNYGAVYDTQLGFIGWLLNIRFVSNPILGCTIQELIMLRRYIYDLTKAQSAEEVNSKYADKLTPKIMDAAIKRFKFIKMFDGVLTPKCEAYVKWSYNDGRELLKPVTIGVQYVLKLLHIADHKAKVSRFDDKLAMHTLQPIDGQREGEMELDCLVAKGCTEMLRETLNFKSDNLRMQKARFRKDIPELKYYNEKDTPYATEVFKSILNTINVDMQEE